jgi:serine/threonine-protein kinase RsbW
VSTVTVSFTALPEHVRTARFIAASVARRAGVSEGLLDEIRLAVSEACSLAVRQHRVFAPAVPVQLTMTEELDSFSVRVSDAVGRESAGETSDDIMEFAELVEPALSSRNGNSPTAVVAAGEEGTAGGLRARERIGLAVIEGLVDDLDVDYSSAGVVLTMTWPLGFGEDDDADLAGSGPIGVI